MKTDVVLLGKFLDDDNKQQVTFSMFSFTQDNGLPLMNDEIFIQLEPKINGFFDDYSHFKKLEIEVLEVMSIGSFDSKVS